MSAAPPVLIVDDHPANMKLLSFLLLNAGYDVRMAADANEALQVLQNFHPRLILMDIQLPGMDGLELTRKLKADPAFSAVSIVAVTASAMKGDEEKARRAGCDGYVTKPVDTRSILQIVARYAKAGEESK
jgi:two-component system cell cycle response regulator DivK